MSESGTPDALPSWADQMQALERVGDNLIAKLAPRWRDRGRDPGHEQARAVDPRRAATCAASTPIRADRSSCRCGTTRSTRAGPTPTTSTRPPRSTRRRVPDLGLPRHDALRRDHPAELRHDEPGTTWTAARPSRMTNDLDESSSTKAAPSASCSARNGRRARRRLVGAGPGRPPAADAQVLV